MIAKRCHDHGEFNDVYWSDAKLYRRFMHYWIDGSGIEGTLPGGDCPFNFGIGQDHKTATILDNIDLTNRCNQGG